MEVRPWGDRVPGNDAWSEPLFVTSVGATSAPRMCPGVPRSLPPPVLLLLGCLEPHSQESTSRDLWPGHLSRRVISGNLSQLPNTEARGHVQASRSADAPAWDPRVLLFPRPGVLCGVGTGTSTLVVKILSNFHTGFSSFCLGPPSVPVRPPAPPPQDPIRAPRRTSGSAVAGPLRTGQHHAVL